ncbi:MAG: isoleucine--tRNA ligase [Clostridia bacterium]|nr:isoleucine--tRNA ligase [Clostridia bacterium]
MAQDYKATLNMPKSGFPMRAGLPMREPEMLEHWQKIDVYRLLREKQAGKPRFSLHDGPPFSNGDLHMGHALNKALKDFIVRSYAMRGYDTPFVPGWDNHGMPIESAIIKKNKLNHKEMAPAEFRSACQEFAQHYIDVQMEGFKRMGVIGDWEHPYKTMNPTFEAEEVKIFGEMFKKGYIYKGKKPVYWCYSDETALAEAEIEYQDDPCTTVFVKFPLKDDQGKLAQYCDLSKLYFVIWTTTPWTLPGNRAICLNANLDYSLVQVPCGEVYIVASELAGSVCKAAGIEEYTVLAKLPGSAFELMTARHPLLSGIESVVLNGDHVTLDAGSGCVHTAPGFGAEDFFICQTYDRTGKTHIGVPVPVNERGVMTDDAFNGVHISKANEYVLPRLRELGALLASEEIVHSYPHCWRCKKPVIFRATPQWFCSVDAFKDEAVKACDQVRWVPEWGKDRIISMIRERADWCISRQRKWGLPIPVFYCKDCGEPIVTDATIDAVSKRFEAEGSNAWFLRTAEELLPAGFTCPHCGKAAGFGKESDTLDGWFDSGSSHFASMNRDEGFWPADLYIEGLDQYRGWFQASVLTAVGALGKGAPFKQCLTHGWTVDGEGRAMHKSLGNGVDPKEMIGKYGADLLRLWAGSADYHVDVRCSENIFKQLSQSYLKFRNTAKFMLDNLVGFDPDNPVAPEEMLHLDRWMVTRLNDLTRRVLEAYDNYEFHVVSHAINDFCVVDLSSFYLDIIKDRLYCDGENSLSRRSAQTALWLVLDTMTRLFAPILAFTCDEIWLAMPHKAADDGRNVLLNEMNGTFDAYALSEDEMQQWDVLIQLRDGINAKLEEARAAKLIGKSLEAHVTLVTGKPEGETCLGKLKERFADLWADVFIVSDVEVTGDKALYETAAETPLEGVRVLVSEAKGVKCPRCWKHTVTDNEEGLCARCAAVVAEQLA